MYHHKASDGIKSSISEKEYKSHCRTMSRMASRVDSSERASAVAAAAEVDPKRVQQIDRIVNEFLHFLKQRRPSNSDPSSEVAIRAIETMRDVLSQVRWSHARELIDVVELAGSRLKTGLPSEDIVNNMVRRVGRLVREAYVECMAELGDKSTGPFASEAASLHELLLDGGVPEAGEDGLAVQFKALKPKVITLINDELEDLKEGTFNIAQVALEHIHSDEVIMTAGHSTTVEQFLKKAASKRTFQVFVAESAPGYRGQDMAMRLGQAGIETTLITDSAVFAVMSRVNKVIIGTHLVMADGGLMARNGCHALALAAKHHSVPVLVCSAMFKLCPKYPCAYSVEMYNHMHDPSEILPYSKAKVVRDASIVHPLFDYVPPDLVSLFISNIGANAPSYIYRLLSEYYDE
eukprot:m.136708 g.136708  ORF g.136708 m.136708 type:complete len:406 (+) comp11443_c0_seq1:272-1489(+)